MRRIAVIPLFLLVACGAYAEGGGSQAAIGYAMSLYPGAKLFDAEDVMTKECGEVESPGIVTMDMDNDGLQDYALMLKGEIEDYVYNGETYDALPLWLVVLLGDRKEGFRLVHEESILSGPPSTAGIKEFALSNHDQETIDNMPEMVGAGFELYFCGRSSTLLYWDGESVSYYTLAD